MKGRVYAAHMLCVAVPYGIANNVVLLIVVEEALLMVGW